MLGNIFENVKFIGVNESTMTNNEIMHTILNLIAYENPNIIKNDKVEILQKEVKEAFELKEKFDTDIGNVSDGYHTFNELYHHRAILFATLCNTYPNKAWKSKQHDDPKQPMFDGMFIVGIDTPEGQATYHYDIDPYWDIFNVRELERAPKYDGHTPDDAIRRIALFAGVDLN